MATTSPLLLRSLLLRSSSTSLLRCTQQHNINSISIQQQLFHTTRNTQKASSSTFRDRLNELRQNGTPELLFGGFVLAIVGMDYYLQQRNDQQRTEMIRRFEQEVKQDEALSRKEERELINNNNGGVDIITKTKFQCLVRRIPKQFDGHKCLTNLKVGDVVNVLQEGVGPDHKYNLCSIERMPAAASTKSDDEKRISVGWFPCSCLEKIP